jgi:hypothetical protein
MVCSHIHHIHAVFLQLLLLLFMTCGCLLQAVAMLGPGSWFGGGSTIYGPGQLLLALRVVAKGGPLQPCLPAIASHDRGGG